MGTKRYQGARRNTGGGPEHCNAIRFCQQGKTKPRRQEIGDTNRESQADRADPLPGRIGDSAPPLLLSC